jgi:hypothetical protein
VLYGKLKLVEIWGRVVIADEGEVRSLSRKAAPVPNYFGDEPFLAHFLLDGILEIIRGTEAGLGS